MTAQTVVELGGSVRMRLRLMQLVFVVVGVSYILFLIVSVVTRSSAKRSLSEISQTSGLKFAASHKNSEEQEGPSVYIKDFYRVELKSGKPSWEIRGKDAEFLAKQSVTKINSAEITFYRSDGTRIWLNSQEARLFLRGNVLERAYFEGSVQVRVQDSVTIEANSGVYDKVEDSIEGYGDCRIFGSGYNITGDSLLLKMKEETISVNRNVHTRIVPREVRISNLNDLSKLK